MDADNKALQQLKECRHLLEGMAKNCAERLYGPQGPPWGTPLADLETISVLLGRALQKQLLDLLLSRQADSFLRDLPTQECRCPSCQGETRAAQPEPRILQSRAGDAEWLEPQRYCPRCRKAFFPQSKSLGIDLGHYSTSVLDLICYAGANKPSFREASGDLLKLSNLRVAEKQVERLCKRIGAERIAERDEQVAQFQKLIAVERWDSVPAGVVPPDKARVAVVMADAGMLQLRDVPENAPAEDEEEPQAKAQSAVDQESEDDDPDQEKPPSGRHWHEDKVGLVLTMSSAVHDSDPCPWIPETFLDAERVATIVRGLKKSATLNAEDQQSTEVSDQEEEERPEDENVVEYKGPQLESRQVVASRKSWPVFGVMLASAAWLAGFAQAERKAFVADGARAIWGVWRKRFASYEPILDFIHAMSYVYAAAKAVGETASEGWKKYAQWITWVWQGQVSRVIEALECWQKEHGKPQKGEGESARRVVARVLGYLRNNQSKMQYDKYRKQGMPIVSSLVESMVKQISRRVKGTEKFWSEEGAEALLQLRADFLSDGDVMQDFWQRRQDAATGQRSYRSSN